MFTILAVLMKKRLLVDLWFRHNESSLSPPRLLLGVMLTHISNPLGFFRTFSLLTGNSNGRKAVFLNYVFLLK